MKHIFRKLTSFLLIAALAACLLAALATPALAASVRTKTITLNYTGTVKVNLGETLQLKATLKPANSTESIRWNCASTRIATVSQDGLVTPVSPGTVTVAARSGTKRAAVKIKVVDPTVPTKITLDKTGTVKLYLGEALSLTPTVLPATAVQDIAWNVSNWSLATVENGVVTPLKPGKITVAARTVNKLRAAVKVQIIDPTMPTSIKLDKSGTVKLPIAGKLRLNPSIKPDTADRDVNWKSSNKKVATVSEDGVVTGVNTGTVTITAATPRGGLKASVKIKVYDDYTAPVPVPQGYSSPYVIYVCKPTHTLAVIGRDANGEYSKTLRVFPTGTGKNGKTKVGTFTIQKKERWHCWGSTYSPYASRHSGGLYIHGPIYSSKSSNSLKPGTYNAVGTNCSSGCLRTTSGCAAWVYYNCPAGTMVLITDNSRFSAKRPKSISGSKDPTDPGSNPEIPVTGFSLAPTDLFLEQGEARAIHVSDVQPSNNSTGGKFVYKSSDTSVATVSADGMITAVGPGSARITVTADDVLGWSEAISIAVTAPVEDAGDVLSADEALDIEDEPSEITEAVEFNGLSVVPEPVEEESTEAVQDIDVPADAE